MTIDQQAATSEVIGVAPTPLPRSVRHRIFIYLGILITLLAFGAPHGGLIEIPMSFLLKNKLHLQPHELANFRVVSAIPLYLSFVFGFVRDTWNPLGMKDRGFMLLFGSLCSILYVTFALTPISYAALLVAMVLLSTSFLFVSSAQNGLASVLGQQHLMSGQVSAVWNIFASLPAVAALLIGGALSDFLEGENADQAVRILFSAELASWQQSLFIPSGSLKACSTTLRTSMEPPHSPRTQPSNDLKRLAKHWPIYPALVIWLLWSFAPGSVTPLQYHLQNSLHASDAQWGQWNAVFAASFIPTFMVFGVLCQRFPLLFISSVTGALIAAVPIGLMGGVATAAYMDLIIRSCPPGLQGTTLMLAATVSVISVRFGDVLGTALYDKYGNFFVCVVAVTVAYVLILPMLSLVPKQLISTADGQKP